MDFGLTEIGSGNYEQDVVDHSPRMMDGGSDVLSDADMRRNDDAAVRATIAASASSIGPVLAQAGMSLEDIRLPNTTLEDSLALLAALAGKELKENIILAALAMQKEKESSLVKDSAPQGDVIEITVGTDVQMRKVSSRPPRTPNGILSYYWERLKNALSLAPVDVSS